MAIEPNSDYLPIYQRSDQENAVNQTKRFFFLQTKYESFGLSFLRKMQGCELINHGLRS